MASRLMSRAFERVVLKVAGRSLVSAACGEGGVHEQPGK